MFTDRLQHLDDSQTRPAPAFTVVPTPNDNGFHAVQMLYQHAYEDARQAQTPPPQRELFRVMN